eukprot:CAMPEP_0170615884 /NCGR_PEP_ID=MMETSP0224-20130122/25578_1 /TAXON_ID=285029 /ORGANISM="Togula jolla, Strain CCCM 725" /LENGTH=36 /DNA_ID= /DNA_START= /DNA_END= /DNA_ORIENTATION=
MNDLVEEKPDPRQGHDQAVPVSDPVAAQLAQPHVCT